MAAILNVAVCSRRPGAPKYRIIFSSVDSSVQYSSVTIACMGVQLVWEIAFFPRPEVERWPSNRPIGGTVGPPQQELEFLFSKTHIAFMYAYRHRVKLTLLKDT